MKTTNRAVRSRGWGIRLVGVAVALLMMGTGLLPASAEPGDLVLTFGGDGLVDVPNGFGADVAVQRDGKIIIVGDRFNGPAQQIYLVRLRPDGTVDDTFGNDGVVITATGDSAFAHAVVLQADGKIVVAGQVSDGADTRAFVARYSPDGALDATFGGGDGIALSNAVASAARDVAIQTDGKIVFTGSVGRQDDPTNLDVLVGRLNPDGSADATFGNAGLTVFVASSFLDQGRAIALQGDGKIVWQGSSESESSFPRVLLWLSSRSAWLPVSLPTAPWTRASPPPALPVCLRARSTTPPRMSQCNLTERS